MHRAFFCLYSTLFKRFYTMFCAMLDSWSRRFLLLYRYFRQLEVVHLWYPNYWNEFVNTEISRILSTSKTSKYENVKRVSGVIKISLFRMLICMTEVSKSIHLVILFFFVLVSAENISEIFFEECWLLTVLFWMKLVISSIEWKILTYSIFYKNVGYPT